MTKTKKIVLAVVAVAIVALLAFASVDGGHLATAPCVDCGGAGLVEEAACETCGGEGNVTASWWALVPPVIAIGLALITKEVYSSLFIGIVAGAILGSDFSFTGTMDLITGNALIDAVSGTAGIFIFLVVLGVIVALINKSGGSAAFGAWAEKHIKSRVGAMLATFVLGVLIFIDDYFNCLTVGSVMRPVTDSKKVSRAKLSYLIDATAAPICMIAPISSWAAAVASYAPEGQGLSLFIRAIPYNFYSLLTLVFIIVLSLMKFDYGPMRIHEVNAKLKGDLYTSGDKAEVADEGHSAKGKVIDLILPIIVLIVACVFALVYNGGILDGSNFIDAFSNTDATVGLPWGSLIALVFAIAYFCIRKVVTFKEAMEAIPKGFIAMVPAILILTFATALKNMTGVLGAKPFVNDVMSNVPDSLASFIPAIVFLVACFISFATGTSWGTFGILIPIVITIFDVGDPLQIVAMSACLAGSVCGDHCSPISDTTIMSSAGGQCNHLNHVSTQLPYAITVAVISFVMYILAGFIQSAAIVLPIGAVVIVAFLFIMKGIMAKKYGKDNI
ncbi:MAG: Na+/H+ antiporter NhaC family protein [Clostridia bacterium]|nr:Na+/H+ antiporter NhaC family protein [Clostridia bacterium]